MARVTIEDSLENCPNMFYLIQLAAYRAHQLQHGAEPKIDRRPEENKPEDAPTVLALREIAAGFVDFDNEVIPAKDVWGDKEEEAPVLTKMGEPIVASTEEKAPAKLQGPEVNRPRNWGTGNTEYTAGE